MVKRDDPHIQGSLVPYRKRAALAAIRPSYRACHYYTHEKIMRPHDFRPVIPTSPSVFRIRSRYAVFTVKRGKESLEDGPRGWKGRHLFSAAGSFICAPCHGMGCTTRTDQIDHGIDHLLLYVHHLPLCEAAQDLRSADPNEDACATSRSCRCFFRIPTRQHELCI